MVFPQPDSPTKPRISLGYMSNDTPLTTSNSIPSVRITVVRSRTERTGAAIRSS